MPSIEKSQLPPKGAYKRPSHTPLILAILEKREAEAEELIQAGKYLQEHGKQKLLPMHACAIAGNLDAAQKLKAAGARLDVGDDVNNTPLHWAAAEGHIEFVKWLLKNGANPDHSNEEGKVPWHLALSQKKMGCAHLLKPKPKYWVGCFLLSTILVSITQLIKSYQTAGWEQLQTQWPTWLILLFQIQCLLLEIQEQTNPPSTIKWGRNILVFIMALYVLNLFF